jgi:hypothetical protein
VNAIHLWLYEEQQRRYRSALAARSDPVEQLAAFATAYVRLAAEERALFDVTFLAGLDRSRHPELATAGGVLHDDLVPVTSRIAPDPDEAFELLVQVAVAAHGLALFQQQDMLPGRWNTRSSVEERAARTARRSCCTRRVRWRWCRRRRWRSEVRP